MEGFQSQIFASKYLPHYLDLIPALWKNEIEAGQRRSYQPATHQHPYKILVDRRPLDAVKPSCEPTTTPASKYRIKMAKMRSLSQTQAHDIIVIPPDAPFLPSPAFSQVGARARRPPTSYNAPAASEARPRTPVGRLVVSVSAQDRSRSQSPYVMESDTKDAQRVPPPPALPAPPAHPQSLGITPLAPLSPFSSQKSPVAATTTTTTTAVIPDSAVYLSRSTNLAADAAEVHTPYDVPLVDDISGQPQHHCQETKQVRRGRGSSANVLPPSPTSPRPSLPSKDHCLSSDDALIVGKLATAIQPFKAMDAETDPRSAPEKLPTQEAALDQSQNDLANQVETLTVQLNRLQRQCDQMAGLMQLKDWFTSLWMKRTRKWEAQTIELERERDHLLEELEQTKDHKAFWCRTATERLTVSHQRADLCQKQAEEIVDLKQRVVDQRGKIDMLEMLLDEAGSVASTTSTELARSVDGIEDLEDEDEQPHSQPQNPSAIHPSFQTRTSYMSTISAISSTSGSSAAESYTDDLDDDIPSPPSEPPPSCSPTHLSELIEPAEPEPELEPELEPEPDSDSESEPPQSKEEIEFLLAELRTGQVEFETHLAKYVADREALDQEWDELVEARDRLDEEYEEFDASVRASEEAAARRSAMFERHANSLLDQEMELDLRKRRYMDKIRNYELISIDLKRREDWHSASVEYVHTLAEDTENSRMRIEAAERVLREEWNEVEDAWMAVWRRQKRLVRASQLCSCPCVCGNRGCVESWNDDEVPALLLGEEGRENVRARKVRAMVEEEMRKRRDEELHEGRRLRCVRECECPECAPEEVEVSTCANAKRGRNETDECGFSFWGL